jgi:hypothetical protein
MFCIQIEIAPMPGTSLPADWAGAFVKVHIGANDIKDAFTPVGSALLTDRYRPGSTYAAREIDLDTFDEDETEEHADGASTTDELRALVVNEECVYGAFHGCAPQAIEFH